MRRRTKPWLAMRARQRGVAMITAILMVTLATIIAVNVGYQAYLDQRRGSTYFALDQAFEVALGAEAWIAEVLQKDARQSAKTDDYTETWAMRLPPLPVDDSGQIEGHVDDMQGRFNLNSLVKWDQAKNEYTTDQAALERFKRLLDIIEMDEKWAGLIADWIDSDIDPQFPDGAEDSTYSGLAPAYRTPKMPITRASELLAINGFGLENYQKLEPYVTALPIGTPINICTAPPAVLDALTAKQRQYTLAKQSTAQARRQRCFPTLADLQAQLDPKDKTELIDGKVVTQTSSFFRATIFVSIGTHELTMYSLLYRQNNLVRPIQRSIGTL